MDEKDLYLVKTLDDISELVYVADIENYDVLYVNSAGLKQYNIEEFDKGIKCYELFQNLKAPCPFCTNKYLTEDQNYSWEYLNRLTNRYYLLKDKLIQWNGKLARLEIAFDMTDAQKEKMALQYALDTQNMMLNCIRTLTEEKDMAISMNTVMQIVGEYLLAERVYIFEIKNAKMYNTYEWCKKGIASQKDCLQDLDVAIIESWNESFNKQKPVVIENIDSVGDRALYDVLNPQGINSLVIAPLEQGGKLFGYFGVDNPPTEKIHNIISLLDTLRYFIMMTIQRKNDEQLLEHLSLHDTLTGLYNRNKYILDIMEFSKQKDTLGIFYLDVNGLKEINDQFGHTYGDLVLKTCTECMEYVFHGANIYRTGGDEFIVICKLEEEAQLFPLKEELKKQFLKGGICTAAIGCQWVQDPANLNKFIELADNFMYEDKKKFYEENRVLDSKRYRCSRNFNCAGSAGKC